MKEGIVLDESTTLELCIILEKYNFALDAMFSKAIIAEVTTAVDECPFVIYNDFNDEKMIQEIAEKAYELLDIDNDKKYLLTMTIQDAGVFMGNIIMII